MTESIIYEKSIRRLAEKNNIQFDIMKENWEEKYKEFDNITDNYGITDPTETLEQNVDKTIIALTINGSIIIISVPNKKGIRNIHYQSIKLRKDQSQKVPEIFNDKIKDPIEINKKIVFEKTMETSPIIRIKTADNISLENFEEKASELTREFNIVFSNINEKTICRE